MKSKGITGGKRDETRKRKIRGKRGWNEERVEQVKEDEIRIVKGKVAKRKNDVEERSFRKKRRELTKIKRDRKGWQKDKGRIKKKDKIPHRKKKRLVNTEKR